MSSITQRIGTINAHTMATGSSSCQHKGIQPRSALAGSHAPLAAAPASFGSRGYVLLPSQPRTSSTRMQATRDVNFAYQKDIQTKLKPEVFADRIDNKASHLTAAEDWQTVLQLFAELGPNTDRSIGLVGDMLVSLQRLVPAAAGGSGPGGPLSVTEGQLLAAGINSMAEVLVENISKVNNKLLTNIIWALALLPDPAKTLKTPAVTAARARAVAGLGAAFITRMGKMLAEDIFHTGAGLVLLGFRPPRTLQRDPRPPRPDQTGSAAAAAQQQREPDKFGSMIERRSMKVIYYQTPKALADAAFVVSRLVAAGDISHEWLLAYSNTIKQHLPTMQPEAVVYAGYALARHGFKPSNSWRKAYMAAVAEFAKSLAGEEFPLVLFTLARWQQQQQMSPQQLAGLQLNDGFGNEFNQEDYLEDDLEYGSSGEGPAVPQGLIDDLLLASHTSRALRELPLAQLAVMVKALGELQAHVNPMWMQRLWPLVNTKIDAATGAGAAAAATASLPADLAALLTAIPKLNPQPQLPPDFVEGLVGNLGLGLDKLNPAELAGAWGALQQLQHWPDGIFMRQMQQAVLRAMPKAATKELAVLLQLGLALGLNPSSSNSSSETQGLLAVGAFYQQLLGALQQEVQARVDLATGSSSSSSSTGSVAAGVRAGVRLSQQHQQQLEQQRLQQRQQLLSRAGTDGLWQLPQTLQQCVQHVTAAAAALQLSAPAAAAAAAAASAGADVLQASVPMLQQLWLTAAVGLAAVMPADPLLVLLGEVLDLPDDQATLLGLTGLTAGLTRSSGPTPQAAGVQALLEAAVYKNLPATTSSSSVVKGSRRATAAAAAAVGGNGQQQQRDLLRIFSVLDFTELLVIIGDAELAGSMPHVLLDTAAEALHGSMVMPSVTTAPVYEGAELTDGTAQPVMQVKQKPSAYGFECTYAEAADLVKELATVYKYSLPAKVKAKFKKWVGPDGPLPEELQVIRGRKKAASSSGSGDSGDGGKKKAAPAPALAAPAPAPAASMVAGVGADDAASYPVMPQVAPPAAAAAAAPPGPAPAPPAPAAPTVGADGVVRSARRR